MRDKGITYNEDSQKMAVLNGREEKIMAIVITNGEYYINLNQVGEHRKTKDIAQAIQYKSAREAISYMYKAPAKTDGYYVYDTIADCVVWKRLTEEEKIALQERKNVITNVKRRNNGRIKRKQYSQATRKLIYQKYDGRCQLCGRRILFSELSLDHHIPLAMGGMDDISNLIATCIPCNQFKSNIAPELFEGRINEIFIYQMSKKYGNKLRWKIISRWLCRMTL